MGHPPRIYTPDVSIHVIRRGNNRGVVFRDDDDRHMFLHVLQDGAEDYRVSVHGFVLMDTHYHLLVTPQTEFSIPDMMKELGERYVRYYNRKHDRIGTAWAGRYRAIPMKDERQWLTCLRYIEQNPWRAKMVDTPELYRWSSCRVHTLGETLSWLVPHHLYLALGPTPAQRQEAYRVICGVSLTDEELVRLRHLKPR